MHHIAASLPLPLLSVLFLYSIAVELIGIIATTVLLEDFFKAVTGESLGSIQNTKYLKVLTTIDRAMAFYALTTSIALTIILFAAFRKVQKWSWWAILVVGIGGWLWGLIDNVAVGASLTIAIYSIGTVVFLVGIFLPIKVFFAKSSQQAYLLGTIVR